jgi:DNA-directed RNA polymerase subunit RPC12/RpoP
MPVVTYRCPNCGGELTFDPTHQQFSCEYCDTNFSEEEIKALYPEETELEKEGNHSSEEEYRSHTKTYECPSCGACLITDDTTAASVCCYCHTPVILSERLSGGLRPAKIIPFSLSKEHAGKCFLDWCRGKLFVPSDFKAAPRLDEISGVYLPFWLADCSTSASVEGQGRKVRMWTAGKVRYTETKVYRILRAGKLRFPGIPAIGLKKTDENLMNGIMPYDDSKTEDFSMTYLSGFMTERYDLTKEDVTPAVCRQVKGYTEAMLRNTVTGYTSMNLDSPQVKFDRMNFCYALYPAWFLTYRYREKLYYFAVNGQNGRSAGELPLSMKKLLLAGGIIAISIFLLLFLGGTFLW